ncbi:hypothetical protein [Stratiformator vulcanicus]|uniref:Uncharacterized protein n=1 Tax=Stratiformator vulcanicus TaxID=2527980 RepID=A0A517QZZ5_9PLAN|nr:hypothetical protein [Stratiformator vulcanicus]QDT37225.1 hypothetical protein Pan189_15980 [Stratiformator vulcanicus]
MSNLRVFAGPDVAEDEWTDTCSLYEEPDVIPFEAILNRLKPDANLTPVARAKALHRNRQCPCCDHPVVDPVFLSDGVRDGTGDFIPGTATLVGFHCRECNWEWPA